MKRIFITLCLGLFALHSNAQHYQWIKGGGSTVSFTTSIDWEEVYELCTDEHGNVYALSKVGDQNIQADTFHLTRAHSLGGTPFVNLLLTSYDCNGNMRWARYFENNAFSFPHGLVYDGNGNLYVGASSYINKRYIGDSLIDTSSFLHSFVTRFDTNGNFKWIRYVGNDQEYATYTSTGGSYGSIATDGKKRVHYFNYAGTGVHLSPTIVGSGGLYDLMYDSTGNLLKAVHLHTLDTNWFPQRVALDNQSGKIYTTLQQSNTYYNAVAAFDSSGEKIWWKWVGDTLSGGGDQSDLFGIIYNSGNLYVSGAAYKTFVFNFTDSVTNTSYPHGDLSVIANIDTSGALKWIYKNDGSAVNDFFNLTQLPNGYLAAIGIAAYSVKHGLDSFDALKNDPMLTIIDTTARLILLSDISCDALYNQGRAITSDKLGNIYIGGYVANQISPSGIPPYTTHGGNSDFFVAKFGYSCNCSLSSIPTPLFTVSGDSTHVPDAVTFTYTGTNAPDSVHWDFGDGITSTTLNPTHTYSDTGILHVCLTVFGCDSGTYCTYIKTLPPTGISNINLFPNINVYPNPISGQFFIEGAEIGTTVRLLNILGQVVFEGTITEKKQQINSDDLRLGTYLLQLIDKKGGKMSMTIVRQ